MVGSACRSARYRWRRSPTCCRDCARPYRRWADATDCVRALWLIDAVLLVGALGVALFASGQDAAGRGIVWLFPIAIGLALAGSVLAARNGANGLALGIGGIAPVV